MIQREHLVVAFLAVLTATGNGQDMTSPKEPSVSITHKVVDTNHEVAKYMNRSSDLYWLRTSTISIRIKFDSSPNTGTVRFDLDAVDHDGFLIKRFRMPDVALIQGRPAIATRIAAIHSEKLARVHSWRISGAEMVANPTAISLDDLTYKVVKDEALHEIKLKARIRRGNSIAFPVSSQTLAAALVIDWEREGRW